MVKMNGTSAVQGSISYVPQQAWVMNETLRDNILFGKDYDEERYGPYFFQFLSISYALQFVICILDSLNIVAVLLT